MKYDVRHTCGHERTVALFGPGATRQGRLRGLAGMPCPGCLSAIDLGRAMDAEWRDGLPGLIGSPKQVDWALRCRLHALRLVDRVLADAECPPETLPVSPDRLFPGEAEPPLAAALDRLRAQDAARFWIDHAKEAERVSGDLDHHRDGQRLRVTGRIEDMMSSQHTPTGVVADLLLAASGNGSDEPAARFLARLLRPSGAAIQRAAGPATPVGMALEIIERALRRAKRPYVAFSGGKDSLVVAHLVRSVCPDVVLAWSDDELEYPESVAYHERWRRDLGAAYVTTLGHTTHAGWFRPWEDRPLWRAPLPGAIPIGMPQDDWMAREGYDLTFTGTRGIESGARRDNFIVRGALYRVRSGTGLRCSPIHDWTDHDVWGHIADHALAANPAYARLAEIETPIERQRIGPLPLVPGDVLSLGWPDLLARLEARYGARWG